MTLLIPVTDALPAVREHSKRWPNDDASETPEQVREMAELAEVRVGQPGAAGLR